MLSVRVSASLALLALTLPGSASADQQKETLSKLSDVDVQQSKKDVVVTVIGSKAPDFTSFTMSKPFRVVVDWAGSRIEGAEEQRFERGLIRSVQMKQFDSEAEQISRVTIELSRETAYHVEADGTKVSVHFEPVPDPIPEPKPEPVAKKKVEEKKKTVAYVPEGPLTEPDVPVPENPPAPPKPQIEIAKLPKPEPKPEPVVEAKPAPAKPKPEPVVAEAKPAPKPEPAAKPEPKPEPVVAAAKPEPKPESVTAKKAEPQPEPVVVAKKPEPVVEPKPEPAKPEPVVAKKAEPKPEPVVAAAKPEPKPEPVVPPKPVKAEPVVATAKPEPKPERAPEPKEKPEPIQLASYVPKVQPKTVPVKAKTTEPPVRMTSPTPAPVRRTPSRRTQQLASAAPKELDSGWTPPGAGKVRKLPVVRFGVGQETLQPSGETPLDPEQPLPEGDGDFDPGPRTMSYIGFRQMADVSRVFVRLDGKAKYKQYREGGNMILELVNTSVPVKNNTRPLDTSYFNSPVTNVQAVPSGGNTRVTVQLKEAVPFKVKRIGTTIAVDFTRR